MVVVPIATGLKITSESDGSARKTRLPLLRQARQNKVLGIMIYIHEIDADTRIRFPWGRGTELSASLGPDTGAWTAESTYLFDSGDSTGMALGMSGSTSATDISLTDILTTALEILKITAGSGQKTAIVSAWAIMKPF